MGLKVIVKPHSAPFYGTKIRNPGEVINLLPADALKHDPANKGKELKGEDGKALTRKFKGKKQTLKGCGLAEWMIEYSKEALKEVRDEIDPPQAPDPTDPVID